MCDLTFDTSLLLRFGGEMALLDGDRDLDEEAVSSRFRLLLLVVLLPRALEATWATAFLMLVQ